jgi:hypothetical protein
MIIGIPYPTVSAGLNDLRHTFSKKSGHGSRIDYVNRRFPTGPSR